MHAWVWIHNVPEHLEILSAIFTTLLVCKMSLPAPGTDKDDFCPCLRPTLFPTGPSGFADSDMTQHMNVIHCIGANV